MNNARSKVDLSVAFPLVLQRDGCTYALYGVIVHKGTSTAGHYIAYVFSEQHQCWVEANDGTCTVVTDAAVLAQNAYMLFYTKKETRRKPETLVKPLKKAKHKK